MKTESKKRSEACDRIATALLQFSQGREHMTAMYGVINQELELHWESTNMEVLVISEVAMMEGMIQRGYKINTSTGIWVSNDYEDVTPLAWQYCGRPPNPRFDWSLWMLEEKEIT